MRQAKTRQNEKSRTNSIDEFARLKLSTKCRQLETQKWELPKKFPFLHGLNVKRGFPSPLHNLPMRVGTWPHRFVYSLSRTNSIDEFARLFLRDAGPFEAPWAAADAPGRMKTGEKAETGCGTEILPHLSSAVRETADDTFPRWGKDRRAVWPVRMRPGRRGGTGEMCAGAIRG